MPKRFTTAELDKLKEFVNSELNPITYLAIDPGKRNGICGYDARYYLQFMYSVDEADVIQFLERFEKVEKCILEGYKLYPNKANQQIYSDMLTSRVIGRVETWAERHDVEIILQGANIKVTGYAWIGEKPPPKSSLKNDPMDAHVHFMYWAVKNGHINATELLRK